MPDVDLIARVPDFSDERRVGRFTEKVRNILNSLLLEGLIVQTGADTYTIAPSGTTNADPKTAIYPAFTVTGQSDEFDDESFSGFTSVTSGNHAPTLTESNNVLSIYTPGSDPSAELHAWVKSATVAVGDYIEIAIRGAGRPQDFNVCGVVMADGATYGAGQQAIFHWSPNEVKFVLSDFSGYNTQDAFNGFTGATNVPATDMLLRLKYSAANKFRGYTSPDGVSWVDVTGEISITLTPTYVGFFYSTWGGTLPFVWSIRYFKKGS